MRWQIGVTRKTLYRGLIGSITLALLLHLAAGDQPRAQDVSKYPDWSGQRKTAGTPAPHWDPTARHAKDDDDHFSDGDHHHAEDGLHLAPSHDAS
jgi:hypothetical protein